MPTFFADWRIARTGLISLVALAVIGWGNSVLAEPPPWSTSHQQKADGRAQPETNRCGEPAKSAAAGSPRPALSGAIIGALVGGTIGLKMDDIDQNCIAVSLEKADDGKTLWWENNSVKARFGVTPIRTFENSTGQYCRSYRTTALLDGRVRQAFGTACRQSDGAWEQVS